MSDEIERLLGIMERLRDPKDGCPWDIEQNFSTIAPHTIEEAYEVADAIEKNDMESLKDELGDLLFQVVFHAQMAKDASSFNFNDVVRAISDKMERRHPHVFGDHKIGDAEAQTVAWEDHKAAEREKTADGPLSALDGVNASLPALTRAIKLQKRAARVGFDWPDTVPVIEKLKEELVEVEVEINLGSDPERLKDEVGDLLFACVNLARKLKVEPDSALRSTNHKFENRFKAMEKSLGQGFKSADLDEMERHWVKAKDEERGL